MSSPCCPSSSVKNICSLAEGQSRRAVTCKIEISDSGHIGNYEFFEALISSDAKLSYSAVESYLTGNSDELISNSAPLEALYQVYRKMREVRENQELVMEDRKEYRLVLNDQKKIDRIDAREKLLSQKLGRRMYGCRQSLCCRFPKKEITVPDHLYVMAGFARTDCSKPTSYSPNTFKAIRNQTQI